MEGMRAERARDALLKLDKYKTNVKNWRPKYLVLGSVDEKGEISSQGTLTLLKLGLQYTDAFIMQRLTRSHLKPLDKWSKSWIFT